MKHSILLIILFAPLLTKAKLQLDKEHTNQETTHTITDSSVSFDALQSDEKQGNTRAITDPALSFDALGVGTMDNLVTNISLTSDGTLSVVGTSTLGVVNASSLTLSGNETITGNLTITGSFSPTNIDLVNSTAIAGNITKVGTRFLTNFGTANTFLGVAAGNFTLTGFSNVGIGDLALGGLTSGSNNTALGQGALPAVTSGSTNIAIGGGAGGTLTTGSGNIYINANAGTAAEATTTRIGTAQTATFIAGINGITSGNASRSVALVDANGQMGTGGAVTSPLTLNNANLSLTGTGILSVASNATVGGTLSVTGISTVGAINGTSLSLSGNETVGGTLSVTGVSTVGAINGTSISLSGNATVSGNLSVNGAFSPTNLNLVDSTAIAGNIIKAGVPFITNFGTNNTFVGKGSGNFTLTTANAIQNTTLGALALSGLVGTASGNATSNTAIGYNAGVGITDGSNNTALGQGALQAATTGSTNIAIGSGAGGTLTTGSGNIYINANAGTAAEATTTRIGTSQTATFIAGINGITSGNASRSVALVDANGQMGTGGAVTSPLTLNNANLSLTGTGILSVASNATVGGTLSVTGISTVGAINGTSLSLSGNETVGGTLSVTGVSTVGAINGASLSLSANETVSGTLSVTGISTLGAVNASSLSLSGNATVSGNLSVNGAFSPTNLNLVDSTAIAGNIIKAGVPFITNFGTNNTFVGKGSGNFTLTTANAIQNTTLGALALSGLVGTASGNATSNTAIGYNAGVGITDGSNNTALGQGALPATTTGSTNIAIGSGAGTTLTTGSGNIYINANAGTAAEAATTRIGTAQNATFIAGINNITSGNATRSLVLVDANGQLGTGGAVTSPLTLNNANLTLTGTSVLSVASNATIGGALSVSGVSTVGAINGASLSLSGNETVGGTLSVTGVSTLGTINAASLSLSGNATVTGNLSVTGSFSPTNLNLVDSTPTAGNITKVGVPFITNYGTNNTFVGKGAANFTLTTANAIQNTALGALALSGLVGTAATNATSNTAIGYNAGVGITDGSNNTALGQGALPAATTGSTNIAIGSGAGTTLTTGSGNIYINANAGTAAEAATTRIGTSQTAAFIAGITGITSGNATRSLVLVDANGQLGTGGAVTSPLTLNNANLTLTGTSVLSVASNATIGGALSVSGVSTVGAINGASLSLSGNETVGGTLSVTGTTTMSVINATSLSLSANETVSGTLSVPGTATLGTINASSLSISGNATVSGNLSVTGSFSPTNLDLVDSTPTAGNITKVGTRFITNYGTNNSFFGKAAGNFTLTTANAIMNTALGALALSGLVGTAATNATSNTAIGYNAAAAVTDGSNNTALGQGALPAATTGSTNIAIGSGAGTTLTTGSGNIYINANAGTAAEAATTRIGTAQTATFIAGINNITSGNATRSLVLVDANGQLGTGGAVTSPLTLNNANLTLTGTSVLSVASNATIGGTLSVTGVSTVGAINGASLSLSGNETVGGTLSVTGISTLGTINAASLSLSANETVSGTLSVTGVSTLGTINAASLSLSGNETVTGNLSVTGSFSPTNLNLVDSTPTAGNILKVGVPFITNYGTNNTFVGKGAANFTLTTANAIQDTALGALALSGLTTGASNTAIGYNAGVGITTGSNNTALGQGALPAATTGSTNIAIGSGAGTTLTTGSGNIYINANAGTAAEATTTRIGTSQTATFIAGILGATVGGGSQVVIINPNGQLGTIVSSQKFKENIAPINQSTVNNFLLCTPVQFNLKSDSTKSITYGFIAEEVERFLPELITYNANNEPESIQYHVMYALLLKLIQENRELILQNTKLIEEIMAENIKLKYELAQHMKQQQQ